MIMMLPLSHLLFLHEVHMVLRAYNGLRKRLDFSKKNWSEESGSIMGVRSLSRAALRDLHNQIKIWRTGPQVVWK